MGNQPNQPTPSIPAFAEAPASFTVRYLDANGFDCMLTLRGLSGADVLVKSREALKWLSDNGCAPAKPNSNSQAPAAAPAANGQPDPVAWCPIHNVAMKQHTKDGTTWYSHKDGESWCRGKPAK